MVAVGLCLIVVVVPCKCGWNLDAVVVVLVCRTVVVNILLVVI